MSNRIDTTSVHDTTASGKRSYGFANDTEGFANPPTVETGWPAHCYVSVGTQKREPTTETANMQNMDFYNEKKWCSQCNAYVRYMMSVDHSFCAQCGGKVRLFNETDSERFSTDMEKKKYKAS